MLPLTTAAAMPSTTSVTTATAPATDLCLDITQLLLPP